MVPPVVQRMGAVLAGLTVGGATYAVGAYPLIAVSAGVMVAALGLAASARGAGARGTRWLAAVAATLLTLAVSCAITLTWAFACGDDVTNNPTALEEHCDWLATVEDPVPQLLLAALVATPVVVCAGGVATILTSRWAYLAVTAAAGIAALLAIGLPFSY